ncbi:MULTISPECIES: DUF6802 family protein [unclassified Corynebacterium]|uniref:DUF6802 family protein n=1 Tax=unclassified Corynebacterium TaxID=2624378 RepID=UPI001EF74C9D|nr:MULTISPECIES: DUF6802 family protein [unclassified Corynebacterium]MCG7263685.1 hypothetical protein [Corynebacterium sp. ACRQL]
MGELMEMGMFDFPDDGINGAGGAGGAVPQNPLADLIGSHELHELHGGAPGTVGGLTDGLGGLTVEYGGREYYVDELNSHDPNAHDPNRAPGQHNAAGADSTNSTNTRANSWHGSGGVEESVTIADDQGMSILSDTDGDGKVDYVSSVSYDGQWSAWRWIETGEAEGASQRKNTNTPDPGNNQWQADAWKCVDRGEWG